MRYFVLLRNAQQAHAALMALWSQIKPDLMAGHRFELEAKPERKTRDQEKKYHAMFSDIAKQVPFHGASLDAASWKRLLVDAFYRATKDDPQLGPMWRGNVPRIIPNLDWDGFVSVDVQTREFRKELATAFIEYLNAWAAERGVEIQEQEA